MWPRTVQNRRMQPYRVFHWTQSSPYRVGTFLGPFPSLFNSFSLFNIFFHPARIKTITFWCELCNFSLSIYFTCSLRVFFSWFDVFYSTSHWYFSRNFIFYVVSQTLFFIKLFLGKITNTTYIRITLDEGEKLKA